MKKQMQRRASQDQELENRMGPVRSFARSCHYEAGHSEQVAFLALRLFEQLQSEWLLSKTDRFLLGAAGVLHDIGWIEGQKGHHKAAMRMILEDRTLCLSDEERMLIALISRYHRKSLPQKRHDGYGIINPALQKKVCLLGGLLRIADGLDQTHTNTVEDVSVSIGPDSLTISCKCKGSATAEMMAAQKKADLLEQVLSCRVYIRTI